MRIVIVSGGTGGHIYPGIALAKEIKQRDPQAKILFLGSREGLEADILLKENFQIKFIAARALLRTLSYQALSAPFISIIGIFQSFLILLSFSPKAVVSMGGYVSLPVVFAAKMLGIPIFICEQNVLPGAVNRFCQRFAKKVFLSFEGSLKYMQGEVVGNPVRREIIEAKREEGRINFNFSADQRVVLVMGGSQGSKHLNEVVISSLKSLPPEVQILHIIGKRDFEWVSRFSKGNKISNYHPLPYLYQMEDALAAADLVISRSGATAIAEFMVRGLPMILVPFPYAADNHQVLNARELEKRGAALVIKEDEFTSDKFISILKHPGINYDKMGKAALERAKPRAAERIVERIYV